MHQQAWLMNNKQVKKFGDAQFKQIVRMRHDLNTQTNKILATA